MPGADDNPPLLTLAIENANPAGGPTGGSSIGSAAVALGEVRHGEPGATVLLAVELIREVDRDRDDLIPAIERLMSVGGTGGGGRSLKHVRQVAVSVGPGGFTSTRVACATGAMLAEGLGAAVIAVPSALVAVHKLAGPVPGVVAVLMASKGDSVWCALLDGHSDVQTLASHGAAQARAGRMMTGPQVVALRPSLALADRHLPESVRGELTAAGIPIQPLAFSAEACLRAAAVCEPGDPGTLVPIYPREPEAVTLWRLRHGPSAAPKG